MIGCFLIWVLDFSIISMTNCCHSGSPTRGSYHSYISKNLRVSQAEKKRGRSEMTLQSGTYVAVSVCSSSSLMPHGFQLSYARVNQIKWGYSHLTPTPSDRLFPYSLGFRLILGYYFYIYKVFKGCEREKKNSRFPELMFLLSLNYFKF